MFSFLDVIKSNNFEYSSFSMLLNVWTVPDFNSISKSKDRVLPPPLAKLTDVISSKRIWSGGLCTYIKPLSSGYKNPAAALNEHPTAGVPEFLYDNSIMLFIASFFLKTVYEPYETTWACKFPSNNMFHNFTQNFISWSRHFLFQFTFKLFFYFLTKNQLIKLVQFQINFHLLRER